MSSASTRVFISYSHDSKEHMDAVLALSNRLRKEGVDCWIDQYLRSPSEGWPRWCGNQITEAKFVLVVCTETYLRRFEGKEVPGKGKGVTFEGFIITQELYDAQGRNDKFIPIVFAAAGRQHIPVLLRGASNYDVSTSDGYDELYFGILGQPRVIAPGLGPTRNRSAAVAFAPLRALQSIRDFAPFNIPLAPNPFFTESGNTLGKLREKLGPSKCVALSGMPGVGKTQAAAEYAYRHRKDYQAVLWARAETRDTLVADFSSIARLLSLPEKDERDQSVIVAAVKSWLAANDGWLLILDNANHLDLVREFVPLTHPGQLLLTTNQPALGPLAEKVPLEEMNADEAALLLLRRAGVIGKGAQSKEASQADRKLALALTEKLGGLPLALDQAGAFIEETPSTLAEYTEFYEKEGKRLRELRGGLSSDHPSVTVTFSLAFQELTKRDPLAADLVRLCAFLAPDTIPEEILTKGASAIGPEFARRAKSPVDFANTIKQTATFSLIRRDASDRSLDIHRLVQEVLKDEMDAAQLRAWAERAVRAVNEAFPATEFRDWPDCERLLPHAKACAALIEQFSLEFTEAARLLNETAVYMKQRAQYAEAEPLLQRALATYQKSLGPKHTFAAATLHNLASVYAHQGRYAEAEPLLKRAITIDEKVLGSDLPGLASDLNDLALLYHDQERYAEAEFLYNRAIAISERALGPEHPEVAASLNNLADLYRSCGRYAEAESLHKRSLLIKEKALGPEHPDVAHSLNNLGALYADQGRYSEAVYLYQRSLAIRERALGPDHPYVARVLENYAALLRKTGRETEALPLETRVNTIHEKMKKQGKP